MTTVDGSPVGLAFAAPAGSVLRGDTYSEPATWRVELNPAYPAQPNTYRIVRLLDGVIFDRDTRYNLPLDDRALADAIRRAAPNQIIEIGPGSDLAGVSVGGTDVGKIYCAYWGPATGPFQQIRDLTIRSQIPSAPAKVRGFKVSGYVRNNSGVTFAHGPVSMRFEQLELHYEGGLYIWDTPIGDAERHGLFEFWDVQFIGAGTYGGGDDTKSALRGAYARWDFQRCRFPTANEHSIYVDAPQGGFRAIDCYNTSNAGLGSARLGRTFIQIVGRSQVNTDAAGGPPGFGTVLIENCVATKAGGNGGAAFTIAGFLGEVIMRDCRADQCRSGMIVLWSVAGQGIHTTVGTFDYAPFPLAGTAFTTKRFRLENFVGTVDAPWPNPTYPIAISGVELVELGLFDVTASRPVFGLWAWSSGGNLGGPLDNGEVRFLSPPLPSPVSSHPGFNGTSYGDYADPNNPNAGPPYGTGSGSRLSAAGINALTNVNANYPPWPQPLAGSLFGAPALELFEAPPGEVVFGGGLNVFGEVLSAALVAPDGSVTAPLALDGSSIVAPFAAMDGTVDAPRTVQLARMALSFRAPAGSTVIGKSLDGSAIVASFDAPTGQASRELDADRYSLLFATPDGSLLFSVDGPSIAAALLAPAGSVSLERTVDLEPALASFAAPAGQASRELDAATLASTFAVPRGTLSFERTLDLEPATAALAAPAGAVEVEIRVAAAPLVLALSAPAGSIEASLDGAPAAAAFAAPDGAVEAGFIFGGEPAAAAFFAPPGELSRDLGSAPIAAAFSAPDGTIDGVSAALSLITTLVAPSAVSRRARMFDHEVRSDLTAPSIHRQRLLAYSATARTLTAPSAVQQTLEIDP